MEHVKLSNFMNFFFTQVLLLKRQTCKFSGDEEKDSGKNVFLASASNITR